MNLQEYFLELAKIEELGEELYQRFSESCCDKLKPVVSAFSKEEGRHQKKMMDLAADKQGIMKNLDPEMLNNLNKQIEHIKINGEKLDQESEKEFFQFALQIEKNSVDIYSGQLSQFKKETSEYKIFENIIREERKHMLFIIEKLHDLR